MTTENKIVAGWLTAMLATFSNPNFQYLFVIAIILLFIRVIRFLTQLIANKKQYLPLNFLSTLYDFVINYNIECCIIIIAYLIDDLVLTFMPYLAAPLIISGIFSIYHFVEIFKNFRVINTEKKKFEYLETFFKNNYKKIIEKTGFEIKETPTDTTKPTTTNEHNTTTRNEPK